MFGGECNWVYFVKMFKFGVNLLFFDELINDFDVEMLWVFEDVFIEFVGCVIVILYDCWFLDWIVMYMFVFEGDSYVEWFEGNYVDYEEDCNWCFGFEVEIFKWIKFKKFSR